MAVIKFDIDKFDGITNFNLWQVQMMTILIQGNLEMILIEKKSPDIDKSEWDRLHKKALSTIQLCLANNVLQEVLMEKMTFTLLKWLEALYTTKSLANRFVLKQHLYTFRIDESEHLRGHIS
ncbi:hypothetical protein J1N35_037813 [Gossypium stocksii]|uniref:Reverse transcriptase Ty1/copia-type domain-containing protein n=1 Tax=Gossypium stocksii TaxID=47602 RepID=A0A9D3ZM11_9ROSI|nr:hypothetical protein J1N35_037813 [Gossypium stocksii]